MGVWRPLSGLICEIFYSVGQETLIFFSRKRQGISKTYGSSNRVSA